MDEDVLNGLSMKSKLYAAQRIESFQGQPIGIVVVESMYNNKYTETKIKRILNDHSQYLSEMITTFQDFIPNPSAATSIEEE